VLLGDGCYAAGAFSFWSVLGLFRIGNDNNGGGIFFGVRSEGIFLCLLACLPYFRNASCLEEQDQRNLCNNDKRAYNKAERETLNPGQTKLLNNDKRAYNVTE
jgi:hypothetical protein